MKRKSSFGRSLAVLLWILVLTGMTGCGILQKKETEEESRTSYHVYYTNEDHSKLLDSTYEPQEETFEGLLTEMLDKFEHPESLNAEAISVLPEGVEINEYTIGVESLLVDFSGAYISLNNIEEILLRAGIVKTLVQLPGIYSISLTVDGQPLVEASSGQTVGAMRDETFVDSRDDSINSYQFVNLQLYFPARDGKKLAAEEQEAFYSSNLILERVIVDHLIKGPQTPGLQAVTGTSVQVNSVKVVNGVCVIDLNESFNQDWNGNVSAQICLYAFVDTISALCDVDGVAFRINGSADILYRNEISLDQIFLPDESLIRQPETALSQDGAQTTLEQGSQKEAGSSGGEQSQEDGKEQDKEQSQEEAQSQDKSQLAENAQASEDAQRKDEAALLEAGQTSGGAVLGEEEQSREEGSTLNLAQTQDAAQSQEAAANPEGVQSQEAVQAQDGEKDQGAVPSQDDGAKQEGALFEDWVEFQEGGA